MKSPISVESTAMPQHKVPMADHDALLEFWRTLLRGIDPAASLPRDIKIIAPVRRPSFHRISIDQDQVLKLEDRSREFGEDLVTWLVAAFFALLFRYTQEGELIIGWRDEPASDLLTGSVSSRVWVIRVTVTNNTRFRDLLLQVRSARENSAQIGPLSASQLHGLLAESGQDRAFDSIPVNFRERLIEADKGVADDLAGALSLDVHYSPSGLNACLYYDRARFEDSFIERFAGHYACLLVHSVAAPDTAVLELDLMTQMEEDLIRGWEQGDRNDLGQDVPGFLFSEYVSRIPSHTAVEFETGTLTYGELELQANQVGLAIRDLGVGLDIPVVLSFERSPDLVIAALAVLKVGGTLMFLAHDSPADRVRWLMDLVAPGLILTGTTSNTESFSSVGCPVIPFFEVSAGARDCLDMPPASDLPSDRTALMIPTSGSTGRPRVVRGTLGYLRPWADFGPSDRHMLKSDAGTTFTTAELTRPLGSGGTLVIAPPGLENNARELVAFIGRKRITCLLVTPTLLSEILDVEDLSACDTLRVVECAGERWPEGLGRRFAKRLGTRTRLLSTYGCSEAPGATTRAYAPGDEERGLVDVGRTSPSMEVLVLDQLMRRLPVGIPGEIYIGGLLAKGYMGDHQAESERFIRHPFRKSTNKRVFRTGDRGRWLPEGNLEVLGRGDDQIKVRGFRVEPVEIEARLLEDDRVAQCAVAVHDDPRGNRILVAYWVPREGVTATSSSLRRNLREKLPESMIPSRFVAIERLPRTPNGKLDRRALPDPDDSRPELEVAYESPCTPTEKALQARWSDLLGIAPIGIDDDFFELGGHSVLASRLFARIAVDLSVDLPLSVLFRSTTIRSLAAQIDAGAFGTDDAIVSMRPSGRKRPLFLLHSMSGQLLFFREMVTLLDPERPVYGIQPPRRDGVIQTFSSFSDLAAANVESVRGIQPHGPYALAGYSFGGLVAYQMAQLLRAAGEEVAFLGLIDTHAPGYPETLSAWNRALMHTRAARSMTGHARLKYMALRGRNAIRKLLRYSLPKLSVPLKPESGQVPAWPPFDPIPYFGRMTIYRAENQPDWFGIRTGDVTLGWGRLMRGDVEIRVIPGSHLNLIHRPNVEYLARSLSVSLDEADSRCVSSPESE